MNINIEYESDDYYNVYLEEVSPRTNYGGGYELDEIEYEGN
jgi:hypothetical protein